MQQLRLVDFQKKRRIQKCHSQKGDIETGSNEMNKSHLFLAFISIHELLFCGRPLDSLELVVKGVHKIKKNIS